jgi:hypothetical protein
MSNVRSSFIACPGSFERVLCTLARKDRTLTKLPNDTKVSHSPKPIAQDQSSRLNPLQRRHTKREHEESSNKATKCKEKDGISFHSTTFTHTHKLSLFSLPLSIVPSNNSNIYRYFSEGHCHPPPQKTEYTFLLSFLISLSEDAADQKTQKDTHKSSRKNKYSTSSSQSSC